MKPPPISRIERRFERQIARLTRAYPWAERPLRVLRHPVLIFVRVPIAILLILGSLLAVLPVFGLWMMPVGLLLLAVDIPRLKGPVAATIVRLRRRASTLRKRLFR